MREEKAKLLRLVEKQPFLSLLTSFAVYFNSIYQLYIYPLFSRCYKYYLLFLCEIIYRFRQDFFFFIFTRPLYHINLWEEKSYFSSDES
mgnify:CR=1 FL=1